MGKLKLAAGLAAGLVAAAGALGEVKTKRVEYTSGGKTLEGVLAWDDAAKGKRPGVLVCHEWWGMNDYAQKRATMLAEQGYVAFALDMYGKGKTTADPKVAGEWSGALYGDPKALRETAAAGLKVLSSDERVDGKQLAAIGYCMGGTIALELARSGLPGSENLRAIACFHTSSVAAKIPADNANIKGSVLVCHGAADGFVKADELPTFHKQMEEAKVDYQVVWYAGAAHSFTNPGADAFGIPGVKYDKHADQRSWRAMLDLFREKFGAGK